MTTDSFEPRIAAREERRQANEALGRSFCKTVAELLTNSDSSAKRKHKLPHASGLVDLMLKVPKGTHLDTASLKKHLAGQHPKRKIAVEVVTARSHGRVPREVVVIDQGQGMSSDSLKTALEDIAGDRNALAGGITGRNLFGRGLSDVMRAHEGSIVQTFDGAQLTIASGEWANNGRWKIPRECHDHPKPKDFKHTPLNPEHTGTAVRFVLASKRCHIPDAPYIVSRLANFFMLRLIAADPNVDLALTQYRAAGVQSDTITSDFPVGPIVESFSRTFDPGLGMAPLKVEYLIARSDRKREGLGPDRDARENGLLVIDDLDAAYDLTFVDPDYEKAEFLKHIFGIIRINGLRAVLDAHLNAPDFPTSPLRVDREGFNREHEFTKALFTFLGNHLRPIYDKEKKRVEDQQKDKFSSETRKRIDEALKHLNKYFQQITEKAGAGSGGGTDDPEPPTEPAAFFPDKITLTAGRPRKVLLLVSDSIVGDGCEIVATASDSLAVQPEVEKVYKKLSRRWTPHPNFFCFAFTVSSTAVGVKGTATALVDTINGKSIEANLQVEDTLEEQAIVPPAQMEFRPQTSLGGPNRRNNMFLLVNPTAVPKGHYIRFSIIKRLGGVDLLDETGAAVQQFDVKLQSGRHEVKGQSVFRVAVPWRGTGWNQNATVEASTKVGHATLLARGHLRLVEPDPTNGGFFQRVEYDELDDHAPSKFAAGVITINTLDPQNKMIFGTGPTKEDARKEFDLRLAQDPRAQQRLSSILLEEASFRALQQLRDDNKLHLPERLEIAEIHGHIDRYKFASAVDVYRALVK